MTRVGQFTDLGDFFGSVTQQIAQAARSGFNSLQAESNLNAARAANAPPDEQNRLYLLLDRARRVERGEIYSAAEAQAEFDIAIARGAAPDVVVLYINRLVATAPPPVPLAPPPLPLPGSPVAQGSDEGPAASRQPPRTPVQAAEGAPPAPGGQPAAPGTSSARPPTSGNLLTGLALVGVPLALAYAFVRLRSR